MTQSESERLDIVSFFLKSQPFYNNRKKYEEIFERFTDS